MLENTHILSSINLDSRGIRLSELGIISGMKHEARKDGLPELSCLGVNYNPTPQKKPISIIGHLLKERKSSSFKSLTALLIFTYFRGYTKVRDLRYS